MTDAMRPTNNTDIDNATEDMLADLVSAIWYGFDSPEEIDAMIDSDAAAGHGFDVDKVKAVAAETLAKKRLAEAGWPQTTDCDKLDRAFARLHEQGVCALHCTGDTQDDGFEAVSDALDDDLEERYHGYCFYYSQDIDRALEDEGLLLAFGHIDRSHVKDKEHIAVGQLVCEALRQEGLEVEWSGSTKRRIALPQLAWQRRTPA